MTQTYTEPNGNVFVIKEFDNSIYKSTIEGISDSESLRLNIKAQKCAVDYHESNGNIGQVELFTQALQFAQKRLEKLNKK